jgi:hypothetical protein
MQIRKILLFHVSEVRETGAAFATRVKSLVRCFVQFMLYKTRLRRVKITQYSGQNDRQSGITVAFRYYVRCIARAKTVRPETSGWPRMNVDSIPTSRIV